MKFNNEFLLEKMSKSELTMADVAKRLKRFNSKSSRSLVLNWVRGDTIPSSEYLMALAEIFNCQMSQFLIDK